MKTFTAKPHEVRRDWFIVDATDKVLGRLAVELARRLRGKHKPEFTPHVDTGDYIVVVNAAKLRVTGKKAANKTYYRHSGYPGGMYETNFDKLQAKSRRGRSSTRSRACCPRGRSGRDGAKLKIYAGGDHPHSAQQPKRWRSTDDRRLLLRHRPAQERGRAGVHEARQGQVRR